MPARGHLRSAHDGEISSEQMVEIELLVHGRMPNASTTRKKKMHRPERWFRIWEVLFPGISRPNDPCKLLKLYRYEQLF